MKKNKKGIFAELNSQQSTLFISFTEAITKLAEDTEDSFSDIAKSLKRIGVEENTYFWDVETSEFEETDGSQMHILLATAIEKNTIDKIPFIYDGKEELCDPNYEGWMRKDFIRLLKNEIDGYNPPNSLNEPSEVTLSYFKTAINNHVAYLDSSHPRYSAKLASAVQAWEAMGNENLRRGKSAMSAMATWLEINHKKLGLVHKRDSEKHGYKAGDMNKTAIAEVAKISNWEIDGGVPVTPSD